MTLWRLALAYVWHRKLVTALTMLTVALGLALVLVVLNVRRQIERAMLGQVQHYDLVVGVPGSETALVFTALFHADQPRGNLLFETYRGIRQQTGVLAAYPFNLGDRYRTARIVGTTREFLEQVDTLGRPRFRLSTGGRLFERDFEVVAGASAARNLDLRLGSTLHSAHGLVQKDRDHRVQHGADVDDDHEAFPYTVVGVLEPTATADDRVLFTTLESYWKIHGADASRGADAEVTTILLRVAKPMLLQLQQLLPRKFGVVAVRPAETMQRLFEQLLEPLERVLLTYGFAVELAAAALILTTLYLSTLVRKRELAMLRALGALPVEIFALVLLEAVVLLILGAGCGVLLAQIATAALGADLEGRFGLETRLFQFSPGELAALAAMFGLSLLAAIMPAWHAYRRDVAIALKG